MARMMGLVEEEKARERFAVGGGRRDDGVEGNGNDCDDSTAPTPATGPVPSRPFNGDECERIASPFRRHADLGGLRLHLVGTELPFLFEEARPRAGNEGGPSNRIPPPRLISLLLLLLDYAHPSRDAAPLIDVIFPRSVSSRLSPPCPTSSLGFSPPTPPARAASFRREYLSDGGAARDYSCPHYYCC
eukprot:GHVU01097819.1.p2 GENE.GHVU01097819.1~~GHVU01097819.1.p2  ORF type:complete len:188 (+),score=21.03 GHVU01097819.1:887-1450(+)